jgi:hypothetical protein
MTKITATDYFPSANELTNMLSFRKLKSNFFSSKTKLYET